MRLFFLLLVAGGTYLLGYAHGLDDCNEWAAGQRRAASAVAGVALERCETDLVAASVAPPLPVSFGTWLALTQEFRAEVCPGLAVRRVRRPVTVAVLEAPRGP